MKLALLLAMAFLSTFSVAQTPPPEAFRVLPSPPEAPAITPYLRYQTEVAWDQDDLRRQRWQAIQSEQDLLKLQSELREHFLAALGDLPSQRTPLNPEITGRIPMKGFHIEKLIYQSLPGIYVTALVYVPDDNRQKHPAVLVPAGHSPKGKIYYQSICQRLVQRGYVVIAWDPVGQGERSQFWDAKSAKSRYNLICAEHAVMGNLAYLAGTNLARWEIWDGIRAVDYLLTRADVDPNRISITGSSGGGTQTAYIAAADPRIKAAAPSCYITALPMRIHNRIFKDPDSDPEQDLFGIISDGVDHPGLLLMMYPRPVFLAAAVLDFFPIEGTQKSFREVSALYAKFGHPDRISMHEGYHEHEYSLENQEAAFEFLDRFNAMPARHQLAPVQELDDGALQVTRTGQVMIDYPSARSIMDEIRDYYEQHKSTAHPSLKQLYDSPLRAHIDQWKVTEFTGAVPPQAIAYESLGRTEAEQYVIDRFLLHHSRYLEMPLLWIHKQDQPNRPTLFWLNANGKATAQDWPAIQKQLEAGYNIVTFDPRGLGETRMNYKAVSPDDPALAKMTLDEAYVSPLSGVLADYVYNSILTGRPYFLQLIEDIEIASRFTHAKLAPTSTMAITATGPIATVASAAAEILPTLKLLPTTDASIKWSDLVKQKRELWPIELLLSGGAYIH